MLFAVEACAFRPGDLGGPCWLRVFREGVLRTTKSAGNPDRLSGGSFGEAFSGRRSIGRGSTEVFPEPRKMSALDTREGRAGQGRSLDGAGGPESILRRPIP